MSANIYQKSTGQRLFKPYALFDKQGIKIAVIGLTTDDTAKMGNPEYFTDIEFRVRRRRRSGWWSNCARTRSRT